MERNDSSIKEILDQISRDDAKAVVEEVRGILLRDLKRKDDASSPGETDLNSSKLDDARPLTTSNHSALSSRKEANHMMNARDDELAFTLDKDSDTYKNIYSMVEWYRDSYLVGSEYADRRSSEKKNNNLIGYDTMKFADISNKIFNHNINYRSLFGGGYTYPKPSEFTGVGQLFFKDYAEWYIKSTYSVDLLRPTAMWLASKDGPMLQPAVQSLASTIPMMQETADNAMRSNILWMLQDQGWKDWAKTLTTQYVYGSQKDD